MRCPTRPSPALHLPASDPFFTAKALGVALLNARRASSCSRMLEANHSKAMGASLMRRTLTGVILGLMLSVGIIYLFLGLLGGSMNGYRTSDPAFLTIDDHFRIVDAAFWAIILVPIAFGSVGLWLDIREARKWRNLKRPEHQQAGVPSKHTDRHSRQWTRFRRPQGQQRPKR